MSKANYSHRMWVRTDVLGLFLVSVGSFSDNVGFEQSYILIECGYENVMLSGRDDLYYRVATDRTPALAKVNFLAK